MATVKVLDKDLEKKIDAIIVAKGKGMEVVATLKELQGSGGLKVCQNVTKTDPAYREVK